MSSEYDHQLLESVAVRRNRLMSALMFGANRGRRGYVDGLRRTMIGVVIAALIAAGCVGYSFVRQAMAQARAQDARSSTSPTPTPYLDPTASATPLEADR